MSELPESEPVSIRLRASVARCDAIDRAAPLTGLDRAEFILTAACEKAEAELLDQTVFTLDPDAFARFQSLCDNPPPPTDALRRMLLEPAPWD